MLYHKGNFSLVILLVPAYFLCALQQNAFTATGHNIKENDFAISEFQGRRFIAKHIGG